MHHDTSIDTAAQVVTIQYFDTLAFQGAEIPSNGRPIKSL
uniref:Uncharacterized protein n=1 Tax=Arundo donax TaxID=35708 RepID=A0A0A9DXM7_ARUDO